MADIVLVHLICLKLAAAPFLMLCASRCPMMKILKAALLLSLIRLSAADAGEAVQCAGLSARGIETRPIYDPGAMEGPRTYRLAGRSLLRPVCVN